jgi:hypothetical protein
MVLIWQADPLPSKNERQGRSANIFFFHERLERPAA